MLGRKAILHTAHAGKRKWQLEQEKADLDDSSESSGEDRNEHLGHPRKLSLDDDAGEGLSDAERLEQEAKLRAGPPHASKEAGQSAQEAPPMRKLDPRQWPELQPLEASPAPQPATRKLDPLQWPELQPLEEEAKDPEPEAEEDSGDEGGKKQKRFAWMDSEDEVSEGDEEEGKAGTSGQERAPKAETNGAAAEAPPFPPLPPPTLAGLPPLSALPPVRIGSAALQTPLLQSIRPGILRPPLRPPPVLPPGVQLPNLTQEHLGLMAQISVIRTIDDLWDLVEKRSDEFAAAHAATSLYRLSLLNATTNGSSLEQRLEKHSAFMKLSNRVDELLATAEGRATFLPADLAMVASALAKVVQLPAKEGAVGRIFADVADEAETRITVEPAAFTPPMLGDLAWGITKSNESPQHGISKAVPSPATKRFFGAVIDAALPRLKEMTCQDLANLAMAYADATREDADGLLRGVFEQATQRLAYHPPPTNALFSASVVPSPAVPLPQPLATPRPLVPPPPPAVLPPNAVRPPSEETSEPQPAKPDRPPVWQQSGQWKFTAAQICEIASAVSKHINLYEPGLFDLVAKQFSQRLQEFTTEQLRKLRDAFDTVRHDRDFEFLRTMKVVLKQREVRRTCKAYRLGNCKFGDRCVYSHDD